jgi:flagellar biosynthesis GTPase FlhF
MDWDSNRVAPNPNFHLLPGRDQQLGGRNMNFQTHHIVRSIFFVVALALAGCGEKTSQYQPPKKQVEDALRACLPAFLSLDSIELEPIPTGPEAVKVNFKATVTPKEDLYQVDRKVEGTPTVTLLKVVQAAGTKVSLYGSIEARRIMDQWTLESPQIQVGLKQFGPPRGAFEAQAYVAGSNEANAALKEQAANAERIARAREAALAQQERERKARAEREAREAKARQEQEEQARIALEQQRQKEMEQRKKEEEQLRKEAEASRQKLIQATAAGTRYIGTITHGDEVQRLRLVFTLGAGLSQVLSVPEG